MATGQKTGGRQKGTLNKSTADIKALAQSYGAPAIQRLAEMAGLVSGPDGKLLPTTFSETTQSGAIKELLDRGYGRARQPVTGEEDGSNPVVEVVYRWAAPVGAAPE